MTKQDGEKLINVVNDFLNTEMAAENRITKYSASAFGNAIGVTIEGIVAKDNIENIKKPTEEEDKKIIVPEIIKK